MELTSGAAERTTSPPERPQVSRFIALVAVAAAGAVALGLPQAIDVLRQRPVAVLTFLGLCLVFQLLSVEVYGKGTIGVGAVANLAAGLALGPGIAVLIALTTAFSHSARRRALGRRAIFDAANLGLAAGASALVYLPAAHLHSPLARLAVATAAGAVYTGINNGLLCAAMATSEATPLRAVWRERFHWARFHFLGYGPLALALALAYERLGIEGLVAFALPPVLTAVSVRQYLRHTRQAVEEVREANRRMQRAHRDTIAALSRCMEAKDVDTSGHTERVADLAVGLAKHLGYRGEDLDAIEIGALLHDIGKVSVPEHILNKPAPLSDEEWEVMKQHPVVSEFILAETAMHPIVCQIARSSHERIDGEGYPDALAGEDVPLPARIVLVADAFDAITSDRPYRARRSPTEALAELRTHAGTQFCAVVVRALEHLVQEQPELLTGPAPRRGAVPARAAAHLKRRRWPLQAAPAAERNAADRTAAGVTEKGLPRAARIYLACVFAATIGATLPILDRLPHTHGWQTFLVFGAAAACAQLFPVVTPRDQVYHTAIVFSVAAAMTLRPELIALVGLVQHVPEWLKVRYRWYIQAFNICNWTLTLLAAGACARLIDRGLLGAPPELRAALAGGAVCVVVVALNHGLLAVMLHLGRGHSVRESGLFSVENLSTDLVLAAMGIILSYLWMRDAWMVVFAIAPLVLIHRSLRLPRLEEETRIDPKTGLFNARHFAAALGDELARASRLGRQLSLIMADLDLLRDVNNNYGHLAGDAVLVGVADVFRREMRPYDVPVRFGGEEFAILLPETSPERAAGIAERIRRAIEEAAFEVETSSEPIHVTISMGVAGFPGDAKDGNELVHQADLAVYGAKLAGRNRVVRAESEQAAPDQPRLIAVP